MQQPAVYRSELQPILSEGTLYCKDVPDHPQHFASTEIRVYRTPCNVALLASIVIEFRRKKFINDGFSSTVMPHQRICQLIA